MARFPVGAAERDAWLQCMKNAVDAQPCELAFKEYLMRQLAILAERVRNRE